MTRKKNAATKRTAIRRPSSKKRRVLYVGIYLLFIGGLVWFAGKAYVWYRFGVPVIGKKEVSSVWEGFYPNLKTTGLADAVISKNDGNFDVLLLGASVLDQVAARLERQLNERIEEPVRVFNTSDNALTSRDSFLKFRYLKDKHFDLIVVYHGINDARMNCCPADQFKDDYTHCLYYKVFDCLVNGDPLPVKQVLANLIPFEAPSPTMLADGAKIKTDRPFRTNLEAIVEQAAANDQLVMLMTFAYYIPEDYSVERLRSGQLDYGPRQVEFVCPAELWGTPENLTNTIDAHNREVIAIANRFENVVFVDQLKNITPSGTNFSDPCHLTDAGCQLFVDKLMSQLSRRLPATNN
jgi:hypothetical protein